MTKLLVLSDSHGARDAIERILNKEQNNVDAVIFLGDGLRDLEQTLAFFPHLRVYSVALFGRSHLPHAEQRGNVFLFNPGSCGRCYTGPDTYGLLTLENGAVTAYEHKEVPKQ